MVFLATSKLFTIHLTRYFSRLKLTQKTKVFERGVLTNTGAVSVDTGVFTGRSPKDRYIVKDATSDQHIWWDGNINKPVSTDIWDHCKGLTLSQLNTAKKLYVVDAYCGTNEDTRMKIRVICEGCMAGSLRDKTCLSVLLTTNWLTLVNLIS